MRSIHDNLQAVNERIARAAAAAGRAPGAVRLLAVSKTHPAGKIAEARRAGQLAFGENYVQEALEKMDALAGQGIEWHLIGPLQANKTRLAAERFDWVQTVDREKIARRLSAQRPSQLAPLNILVQVNVSGESSKSGVAPKDTRLLMEVVKTLPGLRLRGLMAIPEPGAGRSGFEEAKALFDRLGAEFGLDTLSMGMSDDLELAIASGATLVRVGTAVFGARDPARAAA